MEKIQLLFSNGQFQVKATEGNLSLYSFQTDASVTEGIPNAKALEDRFNEEVQKILSGGIPARLMDCYEVDDFRFYACNNDLSYNPALTVEKPEGLFYIGYQPKSEGVEAGFFIGKTVEKVEECSEEYFSDLYSAAMGFAVKFGFMPVRHGREFRNFGYYVKAAFRGNLGEFSKSF